MTSLYSTTVVILAAGQSTRFPSPLGKMAYPLDGKPLLLHSLDKVLTQSWNIVLVLSLKTYDWLKTTYPSYLEQPQIQIVLQLEPKGTGDALRLALAHITEGRIALFHADCPLLKTQQIEQVLNQKAAFVVATAHHPQPFGYGRICRNTEGGFEGMVESSELYKAGPFLTACEINVGLYAFDTILLKNNLHKIQTVHAKGEYYITDLWAPQSEINTITQTVIFDSYLDFLGVNTWSDFEWVEKRFYQQRREEAVRQGAVLARCEEIFFVEQQPVVEPGVYIEGPSVIQGATTLASGTHLKPYCSLLGATIAKNCDLGPFLSLHGEVSVDDECVLGSFVEAKRSVFGAHTKAKHLAYIADTQIGQSCNIGALVVTCNYNGHKKAQIEIADHVFIGSGSELIAPLKIGSHAYIGAGTTLTQHVPCATLITRRALIKARPFSFERLICAESLQRSAPASL